MVYVYKKNKQINKWNEKKKNTSTVGDLNPKTPWLPWVNRHLRSYHSANGGVEKYRLNVIDEKVNVFSNGTNF